MKYNKIKFILDCILWGFMTPLFLFVVLIKTLSFLGLESQTAIYKVIADFNFETLLRIIICVFISSLVFYSYNYLNHLAVKRNVYSKDKYDKNKKLIEKAFTALLIILFATIMLNEYQFAFLTAFIGLTSLLAKLFES